MRLEFESNVSSVPFTENGPAENISENVLASSSDLLNAGIKAAQDGKRAEARHLLLRVTETEPNNENAWLWLASISEYPEELLIFLTNVLNINPDNGRAKEWMQQTKSLLAKTFVQRGIDAARENRTDFAKQCFYQAAAHDAGNEMAWLWLASVSDRIEEKTVHLNKALQINPDNEDAQAALKSVNQEIARTFMQKAQDAAVAGDKFMAGELLREVLQKSPEMEDAWVLKAKMADDTSERIRFFKKVLEINPENQIAHNELESIHQAQIKTLLQNAKTAAFTGDPTAANEMLKEVLEKAPEMEEAWLLKSHLALAFDEKMVCLERVLDINPNNEMAKANLTTLRAFMPQIENEKDEYALMAEEFAEEEAAYERERALEAEPPTTNGHFAEEISQPAQKFEPVQETSENGFSHASPEAQKTDETESVDVENWVIHETQDTTAAAPTQLLTETETGSEDDVVLAQEYFEDADIVSYRPEDSNEAAANENVETAVYEDFSLASEPETNGNYFHGLNSHETEAEAEKLQETYEFSAAPVEEQIFASEPAAEFQETPTEEVYEAKEIGEVNETAEVSELAEVNQVSEVKVAKEVNEEVNETAAAVELKEESYAPAAEYVAAEENLSPTVAEIPVYEELQQEALQTEEVAAQENAVQETFVDKPFVEEAFVGTAAANAEALTAETATVEENGAASQTLSEALPEIIKVSAPAQTEAFPCPFCNVENELQAFACNSCRAVLSLSDLEMLLSNQQADRTMLLQSVARMEQEKSGRPFDQFEMMFLGIGQLNLKNFRSGFEYLQHASQLNHSNVLLASQVHALALRLEEIERKQAKNSGAPKSRTIMVVDDSPTVRKLISGKLEKSGHEVCCAVDGMDALAKLQEVTPDLILLDITMPRMDGYQVCKLIRNNEATKDIPIVMISGKDGFFDKVRGRMAGTTGYITKPFGPETLMKALDVYIKPDHQVNLETSVSADE